MKERGEEKDIRRWKEKGTDNQRRRKVRIKRMESEREKRSGGIGGRRRIEGKLDDNIYG